MKDRHIGTLEVVLGRRRRLDTRLNATLALQRDEQAALQRAEQQQLAWLEAGRARLDVQQARLGDMRAGGAPFAPRAYDANVRWRDELEQRSRSLDGDWRRARAALDAKAGEMARTARAIRVNQTRIGQYEARIDALRRAAEQRAEEQQDEETQERRRPGAGRAAR
jgi:hypothetical protein